MRTSVRCWGGPELLILAGACVFIFILALSAYFEPDIRWLHFVQGWMYVATVALSLRGNRWGYFIGISAAGFWDYMNLFVTTFFRNGLHWLSASLAEGQIQHVDQIIAVPAWIANVLVVVGCLWAFARLPEKSPRDLARLVLAFVMTTAFFAADVAIFQPRYLPLFRRSLHPHSPLALASALTGDKSPAFSRHRDCCGHLDECRFEMTGVRKADTMPKGRGQRVQTPVSEKLGFPKISANLWIENVKATRENRL